MIINAYDTYIGRPFAAMENIQNTLKRLALMNDFSKIDEGVYSIDQDTGEGLPFFLFPLSLTGFNRKPITVMDYRPFMNKSGTVTNPTEAICFLTTALVQQDLVQGNKAIIDATRNIVVRAFARAFAGRIVSRGGLSPAETQKIQVALAHYYVCLSVDKSDEYKFVSQNTIKNALGYSGTETINQIEQMGHLNSLKTLYDWIVAEPSLYKLKSMGFKDFIALGQTIWFSSLGKQVIGAALEHIPLIIGMVTATIANKSAYGKTGLGMQLDPRDYDRDVRTFKNIISGSYPITF